MKEDNGKMFPEKPLWMGMILKSKAKYKDAKKYFDKYAKKNRNSKDTQRKLYVLKDEQEVKACDEALIIMSNPLNVVIEHLDTNVNSKVSEYGPIEIDTALIFSSLRSTGNSKRDINNVAFNKLYVSKKLNENWTKAKALDSLMNASNIHNETQVSMKILLKYLYHDAMLLIQWNTIVRFIFLNTLMANGRN